VVLLGLLLAGELLGAELPDDTGRAARSDRGVRPLAEHVRERLFREGPKRGRDVRLFHPFHFRLRERWRDRMCYCLRAALVPNMRDWAIVRLPPRLRWLYYVIRPLRLLTKHAPSSIRPEH
jgi:hypothetical protein